MKKIYKKLAIDEIENLVFQGGSIKGIAYLGAWEALRQLGLDPMQIKRVGGTSAGSITALLFSLGYTDPVELLNIMNELSFTNMLDEPGAMIRIRDPLLQIKDQWDAGTVASTATAIKLGTIESPVLLTVMAARLIKQRGIFNGDYLEHWFETLIKERTGIENCTFAQWEQLKNERPELNLKELYVVAVNKDKEISEVLSYETTPDGIISGAVRASMSIPFVFIPKGNHLDGGILDNYPLFLFDHIKSGRTTLGLQLLSPKKIGQINEDIPEEPKQKSSFAELAKIANLTINTRSAKQLSDHKNNPDHQSRSIQINTLNVGTLDFNLNQATKKALIESGRAGVLDYFHPNRPVPNSRVLDVLEQQKQERSVIVYVWASKVNPTEHGHAFGHVSIQTKSTYISLWPAEADNSPQEQTRKKMEKTPKYLQSAPHRFMPSIDADVEASNGYLPNHEIIFETLDSDAIDAKFEALKKTIEGWAVLPGLCSKNESCASIAEILLKAGGLGQLLSKTDRVIASSTGSVTGSHAIFHPKPGQTRKDASVGGSTYAAEMAASPLISSPDALLKLLKIAAKKEAERESVPKKYSPH